MAVTPSRIFSSDAVDVTPSMIFNSAVVEVTPSRILSSAAVDVTPSKMLSSVAVEVIVVPLIDNASVSNDPSISPFPEISNVAALNVPVTAALPPTERSSVIVASSVEVNCSA